MRRGRNSTPWPPAPIATVPDRIDRLGATVFKVPSPDDLPDMVARVARLWAEIHEADPELALEVARKLPDMEIRRT